MALSFKEVPAYAEYRAARNLLFGTEDRFMNQPFRFYIDGRWIEPPATRIAPVIDPATETPVGQLRCGEPEDIECAVRAALLAFEDYSCTTHAERLALLRRILSEYERRYADIARAITADTGAPAWLAEQVEAPKGIAHLNAGIETLESYRFSEQTGTTRIDKAPIGVCALITPWNSPIDQIACKVVPALAVGCTVVLKPSDFAPASSQVWTEILDAAAVPAGVFNMITGDEATGTALSAHPRVSMVSFTGSTRTGSEVAGAAAHGIKRVCQELEGHATTIILDDAELGEAIPAAIQAACLNSGQSRHSPTRLLVPMHSLEDAVTLARAAAERIDVGAPSSNALMGPVATATQWRNIQDRIQDGISEGATVVAGGLGKPSGLLTGYYVKPTVFANVSNDMKIAREEIFGPVVVMIAYGDEEDAIRIANDTKHGVAAYVQSSDKANALRVAARLKMRHVSIDGFGLDLSAPAGGFEHSRISRGPSQRGFCDYLELRTIAGLDIR